MKTFHNSYKFDINTLGFLNFDIRKALFFDIETTGFSASHTKLYLIGCLYYDTEKSSFSTIQWFLDDNDEASLINAFFEFAKNFKHLIHFNGEGFDIPYIIHKCEKYNITPLFTALESIDLYKTAFSLKKVLKLENLKQKTIEAFLGIRRDDEFSGGDLIKVYDSYIKNHDDKSLALLILHNIDDIKGLINLLSVFKYKELFDGNFYVKSICTQKNEAIIELAFNYSLPARISAGGDFYYMTAYNETAKIKINIYTDELKYFYPNYKDYYYLPEEDCSIHKSVAFYVDKNFRTQAKAANCYSKKTGRFLPQYTEVISPYFKIEYNDKITYFELTEEFLKDSSCIKAYSLHVLNILLNR